MCIRWQNTVHDLKEFRIRLDRKAQPLIQDGRRREDGPDGENSEQGMTCKYEKVHSSLTLNPATVSSDIPLENIGLELVLCTKELSLESSFINANISTVRDTINMA